jgi:hypothetical protein
MTAGGHRAPGTDQEDSAAPHAFWPTSLVSSARSGYVTLKAACIAAQHAKEHTGPIIVARVNRPDYGVYGLMSGYGPFHAGLSP